ncbi:50S ribosomal protein L3 N(5)-glutamine methyltransferase [Marinomonas rhizomae]|uniref:[LSU ribosomal protein L3P]-glutamine N5-methyltransferase n=1 Tax=Marinomonas rhizomae TaxID=491948 RepID=A0A366JEN2_9GAMM|nr:50S ribosomal protein L3 N(5)-glutamine methyltransferase [Marinomonas rhizomae]RBP84764.1 [LSU ribosomal protein L3P]-glutamine N5-methyltransferase [Marinomonas rhizomae]RNF75039.1 50S ribosomal protein L3 N(5)-glutamine methyltransferase [Marinomonas rhizomae]
MSYKQSAVRDLTTIKDFIRWTFSRFQQADLFYGHGTDNPWDESVHLVMSALRLPLDFDRDMLDCALTYNEKKHILKLVETRITKREPLPYLLGEAWFMGLPFKVTKDTLIPRSPIISLLESEFAPWLKNYPLNILDMCTGSGCLGIAAALVFEDAEVDISDISEAALLVANENIARHQVEDRVHAIHSDMFKGLAGKQYDLIICNPPYVDADDFANAPAEFHNEPELALTSGEDGLNFTHEFLAQVAHYLQDDGILVYEVGNTETALQATYPNIPFMWVELEQGGNGVFVLTKEQLSELLQEQK